MKRMKELWDKTHSKYNHLTEKHLREQALWVINKKLIKETGLITNEAEKLPELITRRTLTNQLKSMKITLSRMEIKMSVLIVECLPPLLIANL